jgi:hypothetical protein
MHAIHADVFPLDGERALVTDVVQGDDDFFEIDVAATNGTEVPLAARVAERGVAAEDADGAVTVAPPHVFHVGVEDAVAERADELHVVDALVAEVRGVVVETKTLVTFDRRDRAFRAGDVERDFRRVNFQSEVDVVLVESLQDRCEAFAEVSESSIPVRLRGRRKRIDRVPDRGAGESR